MFPENPECTADDADGPVDGWLEILAPFFDGVQGLPPHAVCFEGSSAVGQRCSCPRVSLQSSTKEIDLALDQRGITYKPVKSAIDL